MDLPDLDDCSDQLQNTPTLSQIDAWLKEAEQSFQSADTMTEGLSVGTATRLPTQDVIQDTESLTVTGESETPAPKPVPVKSHVKINLEYRLYAPGKKPQPTNTRVTTKRKESTIDPPDFYTKFSSDVGRVSFDWDMAKEALSEFKQAAISMIGKHEGVVIMNHAQRQEDEGELSWLVAIPHGGIFAEKNKTTLDNTEIFAQFLEEVSDPAENRKITINMIQRDPKIVAQKKQALKCLEQQLGSATDSVEPERSGGATLSAAIMNNCRLLKATHMPCERLTGSGELAVFINPKDPNAFIPLTVDRISLWARSMVENSKITVDKPPNSPAFEFQTRDQYRGFVRGHDANPAHDSSTPARSPAMPTPTTVQTTFSPIVNVNSSPAITMQPSQFPHMTPMPSYNGGWTPAPWGWGQIPNGFSPGFPFGNPAQLSTSNQQQLVGFPGVGIATTAPASSPVPFDEPVNLDKYLRFAHVDPTNQEVLQALSVLGINHYSALKNFEAGELEDAGIKKGQARLLITSLKKYEKLLKSRRVRGV